MFVVLNWRMYKVFLDTKKRYCFGLYEDQNANYLFSDSLDNTETPKIICPTHKTSTRTHKATIRNMLGGY